MSTNLLRLLLVFAFVATSGLLGGCFVTTTDGRPARRGYVQRESQPQCHPSQYWDGETCRHKGKGQGARKHDGRRK